MKARLSISKSKIVSNCFIHPNLLILSKTSFKKFSRSSVVDAKKKIFRPIRVIDFLAKIRFTQLWWVKLLSHVLGVDHPSRPSWIPLDPDDLTRLTFYSPATLWEIIGENEPYNTEPGLSQPLSNVPSYRSYAHKHSSALYTSVAADICRTSRLVRVNSCVLSALFHYGEKFVASG